jgi:hypothetical protein
MQKKFHLLIGAAVAAATLTMTSAADAAPSTEL